MKKEKAIELRKKAKKLIKARINKSVIAGLLGVSRPTLNKWLKLKNVETDNRGWQKGKKRKYTDKQENLVVQKRKEMEDKFFLEQKLSNKNCQKIYLSILLTGL